MSTSHLSTGLLGLPLCRLHAGSHSCESMSPVIFPSPEDSLAQSSPTAGSYNLSSTLSTMAFEPWGEEKDVPQWLRTVMSSLHLLWASAVTTRPLHKEPALIASLIFEYRDIN